MKQAQIILYNQLRKDYLQSDIENFCYIHHIWNINFNWARLNINTHSKIIDYAGGKYFTDSLVNQWKNADFIISKSFYDWIIEYSKNNNIKDFLLVKPVEHYVFKNFLKIQEQLKTQNITLEFRDDTQSFFLSHDNFLAQYKKPPIMEYFYRFMRKKEDILMNGNNPEWDQWNFDKENRKFDKNHVRTYSFQLEKNKYILEAEAYYDFTVQMNMPSNRDESLTLLDYFVKNHLNTFWKLEDAMYQDDAYVHHSLLSTSINFGFLSPREVVQKIASTDTQMNNKEWFIRQILGWREYMYHFFMYYKDSIYTDNFLEHTEKLPESFWKQESHSDMNCLNTTLTQVKTENMSHHIQRLMIIGNYALLSNKDPHELNRWFFEYYTDAFEWVVTPNVLGMSQYADWGKLATKPYVASANYINKMSNYCKNCKYDHKEKYTHDACPYNYLYWNFVHDNKETFEKWRQQFVVNNLKKVDIKTIQALKDKFLNK